MGKIVTFRPTAAGARVSQPAQPRLRAPRGADVYLLPYGTPPHGGWTVFDQSSSGGSAGSHGEFTDYAEAVREGRKLAEEIDGTFHEGSAA